MQGLDLMSWAFEESGMLYAVELGWLVSSVSFYTTKQYRRVLSVGLESQKHAVS